MQDFYTALAWFAFSAAAVLLGLFIATFAPIENLVKLIKRARKQRRIRNARNTLDRYTPKCVLTKTEIKAIVLDYLMGGSNK